MKICVTGTACQGKSTYVSDFLKNWSMYKTTEKTYRDIIKEKNLNINETGDEESQKIILDILVDQAISFSKDDNVILDRCVLDNLAYTVWLNLNGKVSDEFVEKTRTIVHETMRMYDIIFFFPLTKQSPVKIVEDGLRSTSEEYREQIDGIFKIFQQSYLNGDGKIFPKNDCPALIEMFGTPDQRIKLTELYINKEGNIYGDDESLMSDIYMPPEKEIIVP
jgi:predicted ATPase